MKRRYELAKFDFSEADAIGEHLSAMAEKGWQLDRAGPYLWGYRKAPPQKLRYAIGYLPGPHSSAPLPPEDLAAFRDLYQAAGWDFAADWYFVQIFCTDREDVTPPDTDERVKLYALRRSVGKQMWINVVLAALIALLLGVAVSAFLRNPMPFLSTNTALLAPWLLFAAFLSIAVPIIRYWIWSHRAARAVQAGKPCPRMGKRHRRFWNGVMWLMILLFVAAVISDAVTTTGALWNGLRFVVWMGGLMSLNSLLGRIRRRGGTRGGFWAVWCFGLIVFLVVYLNLPEGRSSRIVSPEELTLSAQDLGYSVEDDEFCMLRVSESVLLRYAHGQDFWDEDSVQYTVYEPKTDWMWDICREDAESYLIWEPLSDGIWISTEDGIYHAPALSYLIETESVLIRLHTPEFLDENQLATVISLLTP